VARIGLISDTHSKLDQRVLDIFAEEAVVAIVHAGDIGLPDIVYELETVAPVTAVLGNNDYRMPGFQLEAVANVPVAGLRLLVIHDFNDLGEIPDGIDVVVCGHTHCPRNEWHGTTLVANPGSASQRRRQPERTVAILDVTDDGSWPTLRIIALTDSGES